MTGAQPAGGTDEAGATTTPPARGRVGLLDRMGLGPESATRRFPWPRPDGSTVHYRRVPWETGVEEQRIGPAAGLIGVVLCLVGLVLFVSLDTAPESGALGIVPFELAGSGDRVVELTSGLLPRHERESLRAERNEGMAVLGSVERPLEPWTADDRDAIRRQLLADVPFAVGYALLLAFLCAHGRRHVADPWAISLGRLAGLAALLAGLMDLIENGLLLVVIDQLDLSGSPPSIGRVGGTAAVAAAGFAWAKFALVGFALAFVLMAALAWIWGVIEFSLVGWWGRRRPSAREKRDQQFKEDVRDAERKGVEEYTVHLHRMISWDEVVRTEAVEAARVEKVNADAAVRGGEVNLAAARRRHDEAAGRRSSPMPAGASPEIAARHAATTSREAAAPDPVAAAERRLAAARREAHAAADRLAKEEKKLARIVARRQRLDRWTTAARHGDDLDSQPMADTAETEGKELRQWYLDGLQTRAVPPPFEDGRHAGSAFDPPEAHHDFSGWEEASAELREYWARTPEPGRMGISASGGGIRSASFHLGVYQALQEEELLPAARYVASVSGGGYITGALTAMRYETDQRLIAAEPPFAPRSPETRRLRNNTSYLAPGAWNKVKVAGRFLGGVAHNVLFMALAVWVVVAPVAWLMRSQMLHPFIDHQGYDVWWSWPPIVVAGIALLLAATSFPSGALGRTRLLADRPSGNAFRTAATVIGSALFAATVVLPWVIVEAPGLLADIVAALPFEDLGGADTTPAEGDATAGEDVTFLGVLKLLGLFSVVANAVGAALTRNKAMLANIGGFIVLPAGVGAAVWYAATSEWGDNRWVWLGALVALVCLFLPGDQTQRTFHPFYKSRLESVFAVRRVATKNGAFAGQLDPDRFWSLSRYHETPGRPWPQTVFCCAANVSSENIGLENITPPGRDAVAFTFSSTEIGGPGFGYVDTKHFEDVVSSRLHRNSTLPAAVAISGAAFSPSMGKQTRPAFTSLLALLNMRLGVWTPHPDSVARVPRTMKGAWSRRPRARYLLREILGKHRVDDEFVYVTDGGHIDNLGIVELLRRGCTVLLSFDASGDDIDRFSQIGEAIALARSELGVEIVLDPEEMKPQDPDAPRRSPRSVITGKLQYPDGTTGIIVFGKTAVVDDAPWDVRSFGLEDDAFPAHSTLKQLFDDQKFESYRTLGYLTGATAAQELRRAASRAHMKIEYVN